MQPSTGGFLMNRCCDCPRCKILENTVEMLLHVNKNVWKLVGESDGESE